MRLEGSDIADAVAGGYGTTGASGLIDRPSALYAWLKAGDSQLDNPDATAFEALDAAAQLAAVETLLGDDYPRTLAGYLRTTLALGMTPAKATAAITSQTPALLAAFEQRLVELGVAMESEADTNTAFARFKELADRKSEIFDEDILALVSDESVTHENEHYRFVSLSQHSETGERPHASIVFSVQGKEVRASSEGNGPVDASLKAIESHVLSGADMVLYSVYAISGSTESQGEVTVRLSKGGRIVNGVGADLDIVVASAKAYLSALNKLQSKNEKLNPQL
jgi:hypothetical protein